MKKIKEEKNVEFLVNIKYSLKDDNVVQTFEFTSSNKKNFIYFDFISKIDKIDSKRSPYEIIQKNYRY